MSYPSSLATVRALTNYVTGKTFYAHLVTAAPARSVTTVASLSLPTGGNYASKTVTLGTPTADGTGAKVALSSGTTISWPDIATASVVNITGMVLCSQLGGSPATSDEFVAYYPYVNAIAATDCTTTSGSPIVTTTGSFSSFTTGLSVTGTGIATDSKILAIPTTTQLVLTKNATASGTVTLQIYSPTTYTTKTSLGDTFQFQVPTTGMLKFD